MKHSALLSGLLGVVIGVGGCANSITGADSLRDVAVTADLAEVRYDPAAGVMRGPIPVEIQNHGDDAIAYLTCPLGIERRVNGSWTPVWSNICTAIAEDPNPLAPGERVVWTGYVSAVVDAAALWTPPIAGEYRVSVGVVDSDGRRHTVRSQPITLPEP